ncbi:hypothetical protein GS501_02390 [Saccharibacter sp. 17.LH.SD]|uniref:phage baseplate assembly protein domain-containing protein n=1 Tax=Saccharibacter sp. 17.LH.SD TaxID=2689393 RepID=UPI00136DE492|nr:hypothetical protein [Saccharibacter sp. 17.LH.SD]
MNFFDIYHTIRGQILRAVVKLLDDTKPEQHIAVVTHAGEDRTNVPVHYPFGFSSHVPLDGAVTHVFQNGSDPADLFALPPANPGAARMGGLKEGETVLYDEVGQRVHLRAGSFIEIDGTETVIVKIGGVPILIVSQTGIQVNGSITATQDVVGDGISLKNHTHGGVKNGPSNTGKPQ